MIIGIGIDIVDIERFNQFVSYSPQKLARIFSQEEIAYCLKNKAKSAERFAVRFAAKEALYKAISQAHPQQTIHLMTLCKNAQIELLPAPAFYIAWQNLNMSPYSTLVTLTHTKNSALAQVILQEIHEKD